MIWRGRWIYEERVFMTNNWLEKLSKLRVDRAAKNPAPHKPLLLLVIIDQIEDGVVGLIS
jgi:hypothetical protein